MKRVLSYGGGLDGFTILVRSIEMGDKPDVVTFCDVGDGTIERDGEDPGEWPGTYRHIREIVIPLCAREGIEFVWINSEDYPVRDARSLFAWLQARQQIPVAGPNRVCTAIAKVERFERWLVDRFPGEEVEVWIGFEAGEEDRAANDPNAGSKKPLRLNTRRKNRFRLIEWRWCRCMCEAYIRDKGLPIPRKSACVFCPYGSKRDWQTFALQLPKFFAMTVKLEADKPPTIERGRKLSIMGFRSFERRPAPKRTKLRILRDNAGIAYSAPTLPEFIKGKSRPRVDLCTTCGQPRATKATGCDWLEEARAA